MTVKVNSCAAGTTPLLISKASLLPNDFNTSNNQTTHSVAVSCSYDPNDLQVSPKGCGFDGFVATDTTFTYLILFQNLGSGPAHRVIVRDPLDPSLDLSTLKLLSTSHAYGFAVNGRELVWTFEGIELPAAATDEAASHGFVRFQVRTRAGPTAWTSIYNTARIYFDLNPAVYTATTLNTLTEDPVPVASFSVSLATSANPWRGISVIPAAPRALPCSGTSALLRPRPPRP